MAVNNEGSRTYTSSEVVAITGVRRELLADWSRMKFLLPSAAPARRGVPGRYCHMDLIAILIAIDCKALGLMERVLGPMIAAVQQLPPREVSPPVFLCFADSETVCTLDTLHLESLSRLKRRAGLWIDLAAYADQLDEKLGQASTTASSLVEERSAAS